MRHGPELITSSATTASRRTWTPAAWAARTRSGRWDSGWRRAIEMIARRLPLHIARSGPRCFGPRRARPTYDRADGDEEYGPGAARLYDQMPEPKWVIRWQLLEPGGPPDHSVPRGSTMLPVDVYVSGCPPRPEALFYGLMRLQDDLAGDTVFRKDAGSRRAGRNRFVSRTRLMLKTSWPRSPGGFAKGLWHAEVHPQPAFTFHTHSGAAGGRRRFPPGRCSGCRSNLIPAPSLHRLRHAPRRARTTCFAGRHREPGMKLKASTTRPSTFRGAASAALLGVCPTNLRRIS